MPPFELTKSIGIFESLRHCEPIHTFRLTLIQGVLINLGDNVVVSAPTSNLPPVQPHDWPADFLASIIATQNDVASVELDPPMVMRMIVERVQRLTGAQGAVVEIKEGDRLVARASAGDCELCEGLCENSDGISLAAMRCGQVQVMEDSTIGRCLHGPRCRTTGIRSLVAVPLYHMGQVVGVLKVASSQPRAFEPMHVSGLRLMAGLLGAALANASETRIKRDLLEQRTAALQSLAVSEERFRGAFENASIGMALVGLDGRWLQVNASCCQIVGYSDTELLKTDFQSITHPDDLDADLEFVRQLIAGEIRNYRMVKRYFHKSGRIVWVVLSVSLVRNVEGHPLYFVSQIQDISETKRRESLEADQREILELIARDHPLDPTLERITRMLERQIEGAIASLLVIRDGGLRHVAPNLPQDLLTGMSPHKLSMAAGLADEGPAPHLSRIADDQVWEPVRQVALRLGWRACWTRLIRSGEGQSLGLLTLYCPTENALLELEDHALQAAANLATIAIEHHTAAQRLSHLTRHDPLTGLPNRLLLEDRVGQALALAARNGSKVGIMALDLDHFKQINDTLGHQVGDHLLQLFAQRLRAQLRVSDTLARIGGDELMAILPELSGPDSAAAAANKLVEALREPFTVAGHTINATASIGIAIYPLDGKDPVSVQAHADAALYRAKRNGRNGYSF